ncbi:MAG: hypothetical protein ACKVOT_09940 [Polaromonas sp.]
MKNSVDVASSSKSNELLSTDEKVKRWAKATRYKFVFYDLVKSFGPSELPASERRINDGSKNGTKRLGHSIWVAGQEAVNALQEMFFVSDQGLDRRPSIEELDEALPDLLRQAEEFLDTDFYPDLVKSFEDGVIGTNVSIADFRAYWSDYRLPSKVMVFLDLIRSTPSDLQDDSFDKLPQRLAALAALMKIDDCVLASLDDGGQLDEDAVALERLRSFVSPPKSSNIGLKELKRIALSERGAELAHRRHRKTNDAREWVLSEWAAHASAYDGNKSAFSRDYVRRALNEFHIKITEKQMREVWLKGTPFASKPDGLPANG